MIFRSAVCTLVTNFGQLLLALPEHNVDRPSDCVGSVCERYSVDGNFIPFDCTERYYIQIERSVHKICSRAKGRPTIGQDLVEPARPGEAGGGP